MKMQSGGEGGELYGVGVTYMYDELASDPGSWT